MGLRVYPDVMLQEIIESRGCYAAGEAKEVLKEFGVGFGLSSEEAYRIVQLAAFNAFQPTGIAREIRENPLISFAEADKWLKRFKNAPPAPLNSIQEIIAQARLRVSEDLEATPDDIQRWNGILDLIFRVQEYCERWNQIFSPSYLLQNEARLFQEVFGVE